MASHYHRSVGRPRSAQAHKAILAATVELLAEEGFKGMSLEAVSNRARVGKTTIYRHWPTKEALVLDALSELHVEPPIVDTGNFRADMVALLREAVRAYSQITNPLQAKLLSKIVGEIYAYPEFFRYFVWPALRAAPTATRASDQASASSRGTLPGR